MLTKLSQVHMDQISTLRIQVRNGQIGYYVIYATLADLLKSDYGYTSTDPTVLWLRDPIKANVGCSSIFNEVEKIRSNILFSKKM
ncbi:MULTISPECIES: hypothetical protein [unclassified Acinetobacter]|uniref:hypothetical protein n=1 Tax=unclassified Acinetobacter TaxID=196816 RepID=UPI00190C2E25|nr:MULTISPECIES: hypothetical protein [unclassified Acinetobacter]MBK0064662.1 hypothetical protein [Acinetobacter sp. S55]MBK0067948.1 hypothetical protein [Acinetobacter sp. S54]